VVERDERRLDVEFLEDVGTLYRARNLDPTFRRYAEHPSSMRAAGLFLDGYAFEHQGRAIAHPYAAHEALLDVAEPVDATDVWRRFERLLEGGGSEPQAEPAVSRSERVQVRRAPAPAHIEATITWLPGYAIRAARA
jgi:hypothetical protein